VQKEQKAKKMLDKKKKLHKTLNQQLCFKLRLKTPDINKWVKF